MISSWVYCENTDTCHFWYMYKSGLFFETVFDYSYCYIVFTSFFSFFFFPSHLMNGPS